MGSARSSRSRPPSGPSTRRRRPRTSCARLRDAPTGRRPLDPVEIPGPWQHRHVAANGARFHVAEAGPAHGPLVLLLHGFPEFWWAWRAPAAGAGRGRLPRGRDGPARLRRLRQDPHGYDPVTLAQDVAGVVKAIGARERGAGRPRLGRVRRLGGRRAAPAGGLGAVAAVSAPHPLAMLSAPAARAGPGRAAARAGDAGALVPERRLADPGSGFLARPPARPGAAPAAFPDDDAVATYQAAIEPVAGPALRTGVPPLAVPVAAARRRPPVRAGDAAAAASAGAAASPGPTTRRCRRARAPVRAPRRGRVHRPHACRASGTSRTRRTRTAFTALLLPGWLATAVTGRSGAAAGADRTACG